MSKNKFWLDFGFSLIFATFATSFSYVLGLQLKWVDPSSFTWLDIFAVFTSYSCTWLCVTQSWLNFPMGIFSSIAYAISFMGYGLVSSSVSSWYLVPVLLVGWWYWVRGRDIKPDIPGNPWKTEEIPVTHLKWDKNFLFYILISVVSWLTLWLFTKSIGAQMPMYDSAILILSIVAQYLLQGKKIENWYVWIFMNIICIYTYFSTGAFLFGVQYVFFIMTDIVGLFQWYRSMKRNSNETSWNL
jgi:nicotinamide mononucleotide transporter